ncbi:hypothetical protein D3C72_1950910 [compost metagenome]
MLSIWLPLFTRLTRNCRKASALGALAVLWPRVGSMLMGGISGRFARATRYSNGVKNTQLAIGR